MLRLTAKFYPICLILLVSQSAAVFSQQHDQQELDQKVKEFLEQNRSSWRDMNVPYEDGQVLHDLIIKNNYQSALEIGTSTGHSTVWIAWALSKTGGRLITIDIEEQRLQVARKNLRQTGLQDFVEVMHANAHELVKTLTGPFDFIFSDADKGWYRQYFIDLDPKLKTGGCFTAHNVRNSMGGIEEFLDHVQGLDNYRTTIDKTSRSGISISYKVAETE